MKNGFRRSHDRAVCVNFDKFVLSLLHRTKLVNDVFYDIVKMPVKVGQLIDPALVVD